ncbi:MAG TPA: DNA polymerase III subunit delta [Actinomycetes bacterium]|nr:DNA polymerase III subunit delta [Actinomycetes bacterium]
MSPAPLTVITGNEELLVERALKKLINEAGDDVEVVELAARSVQPGQLAVATSPSLFGGAPVVVVGGIEALVQSNDDVAPALAEVLAYLAAPSDEAVVVLVHGGGNGGKAVLTAAKKAGADTIATPTSPSGANALRQNRAAFVKQELSDLGCTAEREAIEVLIDAVGSTLRDLAGACAQLVSDLGKGSRVDEDTVRRYYGGRVEVQGFDIADQVIAGRTAQALGLLRHARESGIPPVVVTAAVGRSLRQLALVASAPRGSAAESVASMAGTPTWKVKDLRSQARDWTEPGLSAAIKAVALADTDVKTGAVDPEYALERMLISVGRARRQR